MGKSSITTGDDFHAKSTFRFSPAFLAAADEEPMWVGIHVFRTFLYQLYDALIAEGNAYDTSQKAAHAYENHIGLSVYYPFLYHEKTLLIKIGYHGVPSNNADFLT